MLNVGPAMLKPGIGIRGKVCVITKDLFRTRKLRQLHQITVFANKDV
jgi:hypothetical protein